MKIMMLGSVVSNNIQLKDKNLGIEKQEQYSRVVIEGGQFWLIGSITVPGHLRLGDTVKVTIDDGHIEN